MMEVALPMAATANMDCYEDMFKEITRKLYGEEGLPDGNGESGGGGSNASVGGAAGIEGGGGLASSMRAAAAAAAAAGLSAGVGVMPDYDGEGNGGSGFKPEEGHHHHAHHGGALTAFGLAALMQNGFPPPPGMLSAHHHFQRGGGGSGGGGVGGLNHHHHHHHPMPPSHNPAAAEDKWISSEEAIQWTSSKIASYNPAQKLFRCAECECVGFLSRVAEHWLGTHANLRVFQCPQCPYSSAWARCVRMHLTRQHNVTEPPVDGVSTLYKENPVLEEVTKYLQRLKTKVETSGPSNNSSTTASSPSTANAAPKHEYQHQQQQQQQQHHHQQQSGRQTGSSENSSNTKRYCCTFCPYATDRRDLFTRHENIHREEKPFQCYVCQKQFNRADHVKKHFLRMHRDYPYDLNRIRRQPPKNASGMSYYHKYNNPAQGTNNNNNNSQPGIMTPQIHQVHHHNLNIPSGFSTMGLRTNPPPPPIVPPPPPPPIIKSKLQIPPQQQLNGCNAKSHGSKTKKKGEKRYSCCYCAWSGVDNWCLKRHLNTHLKPFVCILCDYKAARSERLATHVLKVHNKRACGRCSFLADDQAQLSAHLQEHHPLEHRNNRSSNNVLRNVGFTSHPPPMSSSFGSQGSSSNSHHHNINSQHHNQQQQPQQQQQQQHLVKEAMLHSGRLGLPPPSHQQEYEHNDQYMRPGKQHYGAARLFHYMEASDNSDLEDDYDDSLAGQGRKNEEEVNARMADEEEEPPPFLCRECGCEFVDDTSLETHNEYAHNPIKSPSSGGKSLPYQCSVCGHSSASQMAMMEHIRSHVAGLVVHCRAESCDFSTALGGDALQEHVTMLHRDEGAPRCPHCGLGFDTGDAAERHGGEHHETQCSMCRAVYRKHFAVNSNQVMLSMVKNNVFISGRYGSNSVPDSNMNHSALLQRTEGSSRDERRVTAEAATKRSRKQSQPRRVIPDGLGGVEAEIRVLRHTRYIDGQQLKRRRRKHHCNQSSSAGSATAMAQLRDKYTELLLLRRGLRCNWCHGRQQDMFPYHTPVSLALHRLWRHVRLKFQCEHCNRGYRHRYQVILHGSREHICDKQHSPPSEPITVPKEQTASENSPIESTFSSINVPDLLTNSTTPPVNNSSSPKDLRLDDSTMLNTPLPAPLPPTSSPQS